MRTIAVLNQKGGVGKTTTTVNTAAALAAQGAKVVVIDLDPQAHLTIHLGVEPQTIEGGAYEVLTQSAGFEESLMLIRPNLWLLGANINLVGAETELVSVVGREIILREAMVPCQEQFDYCLIDCAPSLGLLSLNALAASQEVLIPLQPHFLALQGFGKLLQTVDLVNKRINPDLKVTGVLLCMFDTRASLPNEVRADIDRFLTNARGTDSAWADAQILPTFIRRNIKLAESPSYGQTIFEYDPTCNGAADYMNVARFFRGLAPQTEAMPEVGAESESLAEPVVASAPSVETEQPEVCHDPQPAPDPAPMGEATVEPDVQEDRCDVEQAGSAAPVTEDEAMCESQVQQSQHEQAPTSDAGPVDGGETVSEPESQKGHPEATPEGESDPAREGEGMPERKPWSLQHTPELLLGPVRGDQTEVVSEPASAEGHPTPEPMSAPDPVVQDGVVPEPRPWEADRSSESVANPGPIAETEVASEPKPWEMHQTSEPVPSSEESHHETEPVSEDDAEVRDEQQQRPQIQICEFQLPAPPLQSFPIPPARPLEPSEDLRIDDDVQRQAPEPSEGQEQIGF